MSDIKGVQYQAEHFIRNSLKINCPVQNLFYTLYEAVRPKLCIVFESLHGGCKERGFMYVALLIV